MHHHHLLKNCLESRPKFAGASYWVWDFSILENLIRLISSQAYVIKGSCALTSQTLALLVVCRCGWLVCLAYFQNVFMVLDIKPRPFSY